MLNLKNATPFKSKAFSAFTVALLFFMASNIALAELCTNDSPYYMTYKELSDVRRDQYREALRVLRLLKILNKDGAFRKEEQEALWIMQNLKCSDKNLGSSPFNEIYGKMNARGYSLQYKESEYELYYGSPGTYGAQ